MRRYVLTAGLPRMNTLLKTATTMARIVWREMNPDTRITYLDAPLKKRATLPHDIVVNDDSVHLSIFVTPNGFPFCMGYSKKMDELIIYVV